MNQLNDKFWVTDINALFKNVEIIPTVDMSSNRKLNAITRLLLIAVGIMYFLGYDQFLTVLITGLIMILSTFYYGCGGLTSVKEGFSPKRGEIVSDGNGNCEVSPLARLNAKYEGTPFYEYNDDQASKRSYMNAKYEVTPLFVPSPFNELWRNEAEYCGEFTMIPDSYTMTEDEYQDNLPKSQTHYITRNAIDLLPSQNQFSGFSSLESARYEAESDFMTASTQFRENIMGEHMDRFQRERQHGCSDIKVGRKTY